MRIAPLKIPIFLVAFGLVSSSALQAQLTISEVSAHNGVTDMNGADVDWIELRNDGAESLSLGSFSIADDFSSAASTPLPGIDLEAGERLLILASGEDRPYLPENWSFPVVESVEWQYLIPTQPLPNDWRFPGYDASGWSTGPGGFGYGDGDDATVTPDADFIFLRKEFELESVEDYGYLSLGIDYDDGFIAFLNGVEIARSASMYGADGIYGDYAAEYIEAVLYAGGQPEQYTWDAEDFSEWLIDGTNVFSVQVHNFNAQSSDLSIRPFLGMTRQDGGFEPWATPPTWWPEFDGYAHVPFQISTGESIVLFDESGSVADALPVHPELTAGHSVGRIEGETEDWCIFNNPTPGAPNQGTLCYTGIANAPGLLLPSGWYDGGIELELQPTAGDWIVRYTTNGDIPNEASPQFPADGLNVNETSAISLRAWDATGGMLPSGVQDEVYIIDEFTPDVPTFSIFVPEDDLFDWNTGIYVEGPNAGLDYPYFGANFWEPWSRFARMQFFDEDGTLQFREQLDLEIHGGWSRAEPQRSFRLDFKNNYTGNLDWPLFPDKPGSTTFNNINLRNGGQHSWATKMQDALINRLAMRTHVVAGAWQPAHLYLNGEYWGLYGAREKYDEHSIAYDYGVDKDDVDLIGPQGALSGSDAEFYAEVSALQSTSTMSSGFLAEFEEVFDVDNYIDYFVFETYIQNTDWMGIAWGLNNTKVFRASEEDTWKYLLYDTDAGFGFFGGSIYDNYIDAARYPGFPSVHSNLFDHVLGNAPFRRRFINRYADLVNTIFQSWAFSLEANIAVDQIEAAMPHHIDRWNSPPSYGSWLNSVNSMVTHNQNRVNTSRDHLMDSFGLPNDYECTLDVSPALAGLVRINTIVPGPLPWDGIYFEDVPVEIEALAQPGYMFEKWEANEHTASNDMAQFAKLNTVSLHSSDVYRAQFVPCPDDAAATILETSNGLEVSLENIPYADSIAWHVDGVTAGMGATWWPETTGQYAATVYFDGCTATTAESYVEGQGSLAVENRPHLTLRLRPNPAHARTAIDAWPGAQVDVFNAVGRLVCSVRANAEGTAVLPIRNWPEGIYVVRSGPITEKLVVQHGS